MNNPNLEQLVSKILADSPPESAQLVAALKEAEKGQKVSYNYQELIGDWRLVFITGTQKARQRGGIILGAGEYLPKLVKIELKYSEDGLIKPPEGMRGGSVENTVNLGLAKFSLTGPVKFLQPKNILVFDFTRMQLRLGNLLLYAGYLKGGKFKEEEFYPQKLAKQAFFSYFWITETAIAARGRGAG